MRRFRLKRGRVRAELALDMIPLPRVEFVNEGPDWRWVNFTFGTRWSDPIFSAELHLDSR